MRILDRAVYVGPSLYAHFPVIRLEVDLGPLEEWPSAKLGPAFIDRLIEALPGLHEHGCSYGERDEFIRLAQRRALGPSTMSLVRAAEDRRIPWIRLNEQSLIQFGHGRFQQRIQATITSRTSHIAVELASDKEETNRILAHLGLPVPRQRLVQREDDAVTAAERIGYPVGGKPFNANHGRGISIHLTTEEQVRTAIEVAREHTP